MRTFIAIDLPPALHAPIQRVQTRLSQHLETARQMQRGTPDLVRLLRWARPDATHLTLRFLGETDPTHIDALARMLHETVAHQPPFQLHAGGIGSFPHWRRPRVIWLGVDGALGQLAAIQEQVEAAVRGLGYKPETKPFHPHLTLARIVRQASPAHLRRLGEIVAAMPDLANTVGQPFTVQELVHFQSELPGRGGGRPQYTPLTRIALGAPPSAS